MMLCSDIGMVPCNEDDSMPVSSSARVSRKIPLTVALIVGSCFSGRWSICESLMGVLAGFLLNPSPRHPHILLHCPSIIVKFLVVSFYSSLHHSHSTDHLLHLWIFILLQLFLRKERKSERSERSERRVFQFALKI